MERFPVVLIGGPPHSGKSVLIYSLTHALRQMGIQHYVVRAAPDGEGDWANEADQLLVKVLRYKGPFTPDFTDFVCRSLEEPHLPLLVDVGGRPTADQERIFDRCSHAVLLSSDPAAFAAWREMVERHGVDVLAELTSSLEGESRVTAVDPILRGVITSLERKELAAGPVFDALVEHLSSLLYCDPSALYRVHEARCPVETVIHLNRLARTLAVQGDGDQADWHPEDLPRVLDYLPEAAPLGLYGRGPNWIYVAVALQSFPEPFVQFDSRLGWVEPRPLLQGESRPDFPFQAAVRITPNWTEVAGTLPLSYLLYDRREDLLAPPIPPRGGVILSGKMPLWLYTSLALTYRAAPWIAAYQPQLKGAVVAYSTDPAYPVGRYLDFPDPAEPGAGGSSGIS